MSPIQKEIGRLRRRVTRVEVTRALIGALTVAVLASGVVLLGLYLTRRPALWSYAASGGILLVSLVAGLIVGFRASRRSDVYLAKWLDLENHLEDRFASAYEFQSAPEPNPFMRACVESTLLMLQQRNAPLALPAIGIGKTWWRPLAATAIVGLGVLAIEIGRNQPTASLDARRRLRIPAVATARAEASLQALAGQTDPKIKEISKEIEELVKALRTGATTKEQALERLADAERRLAEYERARRAAGKPGGVGRPELTQLPPGVVQELADAIARRDLNAAVAALQRAATRAQSGQLTAEEITSLSQVVRQLEQLVSQEAPELTRALDGAALALEQGNDRAAAPRLSQAAKALPAAEKQFNVDRAIRDALAAVHQMKTLARGAPPTPAPGAPGQPGQGPGATAKGPQGKPGGLDGAPGAPAVPDDDPITAQVLAGIASGRGTSDAGDPRRPSQVAPAQGGLLHIAGAWRGKTLRELVSGGATSAADKTELRRLVARYVEVAQDRVRREEIPASYAPAVRRYFDQVRLQSEK